MKKVVLYLILFSIFWIFFYSAKKALINKEDILKKDKLAFNNFNTTKDFLEKKYQWHYPIPKWDLILLDKHYSLIHLADRKTPLNQITDLAVIQWTTCDILKDNQNFQEKNYDPRFSIIKKDWTIVYKRCFTYSVTKDQKYFQLWTVLTKKNWKFIAYLDWNKGSSIIKSYNTPALVEKNSEDFLPYPPSKISPIVILKNKWNSSIKVKVEPNDNRSYSFTLKEWNNYILSWDSSRYDIDIIWSITDNANLEFVDTNGSIVYISPQKDSHQVDFKIKNYSINTKKIDYFVETWRFLLSIVKLWDDKDMTVNKDDVTLVIRWTKFTIDTWKDSFNTFLSLWHIIEKIKWQTVNLTLQNAFSLIKNNEIFKDIEKIKELASFTVYNDIKINYNYKANIYLLNTLPVDLTWVYNKFKWYKLSYKNWQEIWLIIFSDPLHFLDYIKKNKKSLNIKWPIKRDIDYYKDLVNDICKMHAHWKWLDLSKLYYVLNNTSNTLNWFSLKDNIKSSLWLNENDYILFTSRKYNWQYSSRLAYNSKTHTIDSYNFARLSTDHDVKKIIFACDIK